MILKPDLQLSLSSVLRQPTPSQLARKCKIQQNPVPPTGTKRCKGSTVNDPKNVKPTDRVKQYANDDLQVSSGKSFCSAMQGGNFHQKHHH